MSIDAVTALYPPKVRAGRYGERFPLVMLDVIRNPLSSWPAEVYEQPIVSRVGPLGSFTWVMDPGLIKTVLLEAQDRFLKTPIEKRVLGPLLGNSVFTTDGADWRWQRQVVAPLFRHGELLRYVPAMTAAAETTLATWRAQGAGERDIEHDMTATTFKIIADTLLPGGDTFVARAIERAHADYLMPISWEIAFGMLDLPRWLPHPGTRSMRRSERELRAAVAALITARRRNPGFADDLFSRLLSARHPDTGAPMSDAQLIDNLLTFLAAGHATTAMALTWSLYLLAKAPDWQDRLASEARDVAGEAPIGAEHIQHLPLTEMVVKEAMRLYPPAPVVMRQAGEDIELGGRVLGKGNLVLVPIYALHRHKSHWEDPDRFEPERFSAEAEETRARYIYMPFGAGPRICVGMAFAMIEAKAVLATLVRAMRFTPIDGCDPEPMSRLTLRPMGGMRLGVTPR
ncbi:MAG: cytochrome P450 [Hyphomicrobiaceae bacterium]